MSDFQSGLSADQAHKRLRESLSLLQRAEKNAVLWFDEIRRRSLYRQLGYSSIHAYAVSELGFSKSRCSQFIRLTESLEKLPMLRDSVARGEVAWTKARELTKVASPANEAGWVEEAKNSSRRELEAKVKVCRDRAKSERRQDPAQALLLDGVEASSENGVGGVAGNAAARGATKVSAETARDLTCEAPVSVSLRFTPEQFVRYEALVEQLHKRRSGRMPDSLPVSRLPAGREELLLAGLSSLLDSISMKQKDASHAPTREGIGGATDPVHEKPAIDSASKARIKEFPRGNSGPAFQIVVHKCEDCGRASVVSGRGDLALSAPTLSRVECDSRTQRPGKRNKSSIPPGLRRRVLARDGHRCRAPGCVSTRFLEVHHIRPRVTGGGNEAENLITLCASCHQLLHEMSATGTSSSAWIAAGDVLKY